MNLYYVVKHEAMRARPAGVSSAQVEEIVVSIGDILDAAQTLIDGCPSPSHKSYRGKRKPISDCEVCDGIWKARKLLEALR